MEQILRRELKTWQKAFKAKRGRDPTKRDILADPGIAGTYDTWQAVGGDVKAKPKSRSSKAASSSKTKLDAGEEVFKTPSKRKSQGKSTAAVSAASPSRNPFRTPTKSQSSPLAVTPARAGRGRNPFASPAKPSPPVSPARSLIEVEMTQTKRSPLLASHQFTPTKPQYITSSPSKLRLEASRRTPTKPTHPRADADAALNAALVAYTPRTKARKRLRGEYVPPTPSRAAGTVPRVVQRGLGAFGFASGRKGAWETVFDRARARGEEGEEGESPVKAVAKLRRGEAAKGFRPLFASPSSHAPRDVLGTASVGPASRAEEREMDDDADALMDDDTGSAVGGLFAAQVQQRRLRRARETESPSAALDADEASLKKHKVRAALQLPTSNDSDDDDVPSFMVMSSSSPFRRGASSPHTELTVPSSTLRPTSAHLLKAATATSSPTRAPAEPKSVEAWRKIHTVELSDDDEPGKKNSESRRVISITPYQRYGTLRSTTSADNDDEDEFAAYSMPTSRGPRAVDPASDSDDNDTPTLAGLQLSPVRHAPSRQQRDRLLTSIFAPTARKPIVYNPEARCGPLQPSAPDSDDDLSPSHTDTIATANQSDDDDDWLQEVDEDFTFYDSEIELRDVA